MGVRLIRKPIETQHPVPGTQNQETKSLITKQENSTIYSEIKMAKLVLYHGEPYQRGKDVKKVMEAWQERMASPELYKFEGNRLEPEELEQLLGGASLFSETKIIRVTQADELVGNDSFPEIIDRHPFKTEGLLLESESVKKNTKLYKAVDNKGKTKKFSEPSNSKEFRKYGSKILQENGVRLTPDARKWFFQVMEEDLLRVDREAEKLALYKENEELSREQAKEVVWAGGKDKMFDFFDALFAGNTEEAIGMLEEMLAKGVEESKIFFMLAKEVRRLVKIQDLASNGASNKEISSKTGIYKWLVKKKRGQLSNFTADELEDLLHLLHQEDLKFKQGQTDIEDALFRVVYRTYPVEN